MNLETMTLYQDEAYDYYNFYLKNHEKFGWKKIGSSSRTTNYEKDGYTAEVVNDKVVLKEHYDYYSSGRNSITLQRDKKTENYEKIREYEITAKDRLKSKDRTYRWYVGFCIITPIFFLLFPVLSNGVVLLMKDIPNIVFQTSPDFYIRELLMNLSVFLQLTIISVIIFINILLIVLCVKLKKKQKRLYAEAEALADEAKKLLPQQK